MDGRAYGPNLAATKHGAALRTSSQAAGERPARLDDSRPLGGYSFNWQNGFAQPMDCWFWSDGPVGEGPEWVQVEWDEEQTFDEIVLRMPILILLSGARRTLGRLALQHRDERSGEWRLVEPTNGEPNPISRWVVPDRPDDSATKAFELEPITTSSLRVVFDEGNVDGRTFLGAIEVYRRGAATPPYALRHAADADDWILEPGDDSLAAVQVTDAEGRALMGYPVAFSLIGGAGEPVGATQIRTDRAGRAEVITATGPGVGASRYVAAGARSVPSEITIERHTLDRSAALAAGLEWLEERAAELQSGSRRVAVDGTVMYTPDGVGSYDGFWVRDFAYMIEGAPRTIPHEDIWNAFEYWIARQRADGAIPNKVFGDGTPLYCPGPGCDSVFGPAPPPDNPSFMVKIAHRHSRLTGDPALFDRYKDELTRGMEFVPRSPNTSLVYIPPEGPSSPYGFSDAIAKTGDQLFDSLLYHEAAGLLAQLYEEIGDESGAGRWTDEAAAVSRDLQTLFDGDSGMFLAASGDCRQIDIWGSAYAAHIGAIPAEQRMGVARYLKTNYEGIVCRGQVRHTAPGEYWERTIVPNEEIYQNGPYWAIPSGWVATVIATVDRELARRMLVDLVKDFQRNGVNEAINPRVGYVAIPNYVASACNPIPALTELARDAP